MEVARVSPEAAWDRSIDVTQIRSVLDAPTGDSSEADQIGQFSRAIEKLSANQKEQSVVRNTCIYLQLPDAIRFRVCRHLISLDHNPVRLEFVTKPTRLTHAAYDRHVWPEASFESLADVYSRLGPYLAVSYGMRQDIMAALLTTQKFRMTVSPHVGKLLNDKGFSFLQTFGSYMTAFTLEVDLSRLGFGRHEASSTLAPGTWRLESLIRDVVDSLKELRSDDAPLTTFTLLIRRYYGNREDGTAYCDDAHLKVLKPVAELRGLVESVRVVGCSSAYAAEVVAGLWPEKLSDTEVIRQPVQHFAPSSLYPLLPTQSSYLDYGPGLGVRRIQHPSEFRGLWDVVLDEASMRAEQQQQPPRASSNMRLSSSIASMDSSEPPDTPRRAASMRWPGALLRRQQQGQHHPEHMVGHPALRPRLSLDTLISSRQPLPPRPGSGLSERSERVLVKKAPQRVAT